jgi:hypothetical protein
MEMGIEVTSMMGEKRIVPRTVQLFYHISKDENEFVCHEFYSWYSGFGRDAWKRFSNLKEAEKYAKVRGGHSAYF